MNYRPLSDQEIMKLMHQGCHADDWANITVKDGFRSETVRNVTFSGKVKLGLFGSDIEAGGLKRPSGLYNSHIHECTIGDNVYIGHTGMVSNYIIEDQVVIINTASVSVSRETTFGNGTEIEILNEAGGRELIIFDQLSAQLAYLLVFYQHDRELITRLKSVIQAEIEAGRSGTGRIGTFTRIQYAGIIHNVKIGGYASISGTRLLEEGSIVSNQHAPVQIGENVIAKKFIVLSGSSISGGAVVDKCFIGQGVSIGKQYSAENSAFFANSDVALGEGCSIFAGPYTVTHHKATLLLAGMFSFYNAGSGTNISNHMYKMGPVHQGIVERGSKTGSSSYLLWPCRIGAYNVVVGKHFANFDTRDFPFSYIKEEKGKSVLFPAMNLFTVGTRRDSEKWPARDKRKDPVKQDLVHFDLFNPYIAGRMVNAIRLLDGLAERAQKTQEYVGYNGLHIPRLLLRTTRKFYEMALKVYLGNAVADRLESANSELTLKKVENMFTPAEAGSKAWCDIAGMFAPAEEIERLTGDIRKNKFSSVAQILERITDIYSGYKQYAWNWCLAYLESETTDKQQGIINRERLVGIIEEWQANAVKLNNMILQDATKEFDQNSRFGYGIDGDENVNALDFEAVRGSYEANKFVTALKAESRTIEERGKKLRDLLQTMV